MTKRISLGAFGALFLALVLAGAWASWKESSSRDAWVLDDPVRLLTDFTSSEKVDVSFRLRNTGRVPLRIFGASFC